MSLSTVIRNNIAESIALKSTILEDPQLIQLVEEISELMITTFKNKKKVYLCGNGGSAADAQHLAAEFSGRYYYDRPPLYAEALHVNTSYITAVANDYSYDEIYARMIRAAGEKGDLLIGLSTSGNSPNVIKAMEEAKNLGMITIGFSGETGGEMKKCSDYLLAIPSQNTPRIQECHMLLGHSICELVESGVFPK